MDTRPHIIILPIALAIGILLGWNYPGWIGPIILIPLSLMIYLLILGMSKRPERAYRISKWHLVWLSILFIGIGMATMEIQRADEVPPINLHAVVSARVIETRQFTQGDRMTVNVESIEYPGRKVYRPQNMKILVQSDDKGYLPDDIITFPLEIKPLRDNPNFLDTGYAETLRRKGYSGQVFLKSTQIIKMGEERSIRGRATLLRDALEIKIENSGLNSRVSNFIITMLLADKDYMSNEHRNIYSDTGTAHLIAVSGMHVGIIAAIVFALLYPLNFAGLYKWRYVITIPLIWAYVYFTGAGASATRAALMATFAFTTIILERPRSALNALLWAIFFILLFTPRSLFDIGFQLSVICVFSLIAFATPLNVIDQHKHPMLYKFNGALIATFTATIASWMISAYYFGRLPLMFLPANLIAIPLIPWYVAMALLHIFLTILTGHSPELSAWILNMLHSKFESFLETVTMGGATTLHVTPGWISVMLWTVGLIFLAMVFNRSVNKRLNLAIGIVLLALSFIILPWHTRDEERDGIIIRDTYDKITVASYVNKEETVLTFPVRSISRINIQGCELMCVDDVVDRPIKLRKKPDIIIIGRRYKGTLEELVRGLEIDTQRRQTAPRIVIHNSMRRKKEEKLIAEADSLGVALHSLRNGGPLRIIK